MFNKFKKQQLFFPDCLFLLVELVDLLEHLRLVSGFNWLQSLRFNFFIFLFEIVVQLIKVNAVGSYQVVWRDVFVLVVVDYVVLVLADYVHSAEHIKCVIYASLHVFEVHFLANLTNYHKRALT